MIESAGASIAPRTESEELVAQVWRDVLNLDRLGVHDNFSSLAAIRCSRRRIVGRLRAHFSADLACAHSVRAADRGVARGRD